jgi:hypothetical protein
LDPACPTSAPRRGEKNHKSARLANPHAAAACTAPHRMLCLTTCRASPHTMPHHMPHTTHHTTPHMPRAMRHTSPHGHAFRGLTCSTLPHTSTYNSSNSPYKNNSSNSPNFKTQIINLEHAFSHLTQYLSPPQIVAMASPVPPPLALKLLAWLKREECFCCLLKSLGHRARSWPVPEKQVPWAKPHLGQESR